MKELLTDTGWQALHRFMQQASLCLFDFDGTLAPLLADPTQVYLPASYQDQLRELQSLSPVGIVTGRAVADLRQRLAFTPDYLIGNHGLEGVPGYPPDPGLAEICQGWRQQLSGRLQAIDPALWLEDKHYSLSLHYRQVQDAYAVEQALHPVMAGLSPQPRVIAGKSLFSLLPAAGGDKAQAVLQLLASSGVQRAVYVGDDLTDEEVFLLHHHAIFSIRVGAADTPSAAPWFIPEHEAMGQLLSWMITLAPHSARLTPPVHRL